MSRVALPAALPAQYCATCSGPIARRAAAGPPAHSRRSYALSGWQLLTACLERPREQEQSDHKRERRDRNGPANAAIGRDRRADEKIRAGTDEAAKRRGEGECRRTH